MCIKRVLINNLKSTFSVYQQVKWETTLSLNKEDSRPQFSQWGKVIKEAERIVGYPTSFMNLRWLLSDEFANMALYLRKLVGSNHPILQTAKDLIYSEHNTRQPWGLIILLLAKSAKSCSNADCPNPGESIYDRQRLLAELTEIIRTGHSVHTGVISLPVTEKTDVLQAQMFGNKLAILIGDYLLVTANGMLARLRNQDLSYIISTALRDLSDGQFFGPRDANDNPLPGRTNDKTLEDLYEIQTDTKPIETENVLGMPIREWTVRSLFAGGTLLGRACQGTVLLAKDTEESQNNAFLFGCNLSLTWKATNELQNITNKDVEKFSLVSAPLLFALDYNPDLYQLLESAKTSEDLDYESLRKEVVKTDALDKTKALINEHSRKAENYIDMIGNSESIDAIKKLIRIA